MIDNTDNTDKTPKREALPAKEPALPQRPSYERVVENLDKWANSSGLQKPS